MGPSQLWGKKGEASPAESTLGSWPPRKQGWGGRRPWACFPRGRPRVRGIGSLGLGSTESGLPGRLVTGSTVDPPAPVPKKSAAQNVSDMQHTGTRPEAGGQALNPPLSDSALPSAGSPMDPMPQAQPRSPFPLPSPGQPGLGQYLRSWRGPSQPWLPGAGDGRTQWRLRVRVPSPPQEREHGPHGPQGLKPSAALEQSPTEQDSCPCTQELGNRHGGEGLGRTDLERKGGGQGSPPQRVKGQTQGSQAGQGQGSQCHPLPWLQISPTLTIPSPVPAACTKALA